MSDQPEVTPVAGWIGYRYDGAPVTDAYGNVIAFPTRRDAELECSVWMEGAHVEQGFGDVAFAGWGP